MQRLIEAGSYHDACTTIFPSITPAATTSIITGEYPSRSGILGASWYDKASKDIAYYGDDFWVVAREGFRAFLDDFLVGLNGDRMEAPTLFELVEREGRRAACLNYLIFKGLFEHCVNVPRTLSMLPGVKRTEAIKGPSIICLGEFISTRELRRKPLDTGGLLHRFGMDDAWTNAFLIEMAEDKAFPDFTVAYYADNDFRSHEVGPYNALDSIERVDRGLGEAFDAAGGMQKFLRETFIVITSDHGHCEVLGDRTRAAIHLDVALTEFKQAKLGRQWADGDQIMICPNMRAAQVYFRTPTAAALRRAVALALADDRIDHAIIRSADLDGDTDHYVVESRTGALEFWQGREGRFDGRDAFGNVWSWHGDLGMLDARVEDGEIVWHDYPNAFERIAGILDNPNSGTLWLAAKPGCEFEVPGGQGHYGGSSHGALHALESCCPVIVAGPRRVTLPTHFRSIDIAPLCLELLGLSSRHGVGDGRTRA